jgi:hypothetical protein
MALTSFLADSYGVILRQYFWIRRGFPRPAAAALPRRHFSTLDMEITMRSLFAAAALLGAVAILPSAADARPAGCKADKEAEASVPGTGPQAERAAVRAAIAAWKHEVAAEYGWSYARWSKAQEKRGRCGSRGGKTECEVEADPCL